MDQDELLARIQARGRLYGRDESGRAACAVLTVLAELLPAPAYRRLLVALPADLRHRLPRPGAGRIAPVAGYRAFVARVADRLLIDGPDAAFLARVILGQLNAAGHGRTPSALAPLVPLDLRPLLRAVPAGTVPQAAPVPAIPAGAGRSGAEQCRGLADLAGRPRRRTHRPIL